MYLNMESVWHCKQFCSQIYKSIIHYNLPKKYKQKYGVMCIESISYRIDISKIILLLKTKMSPAQNCC